MKQGMRAMAGAVALVGLLATAGPAVAKDRVIAVDGVSKTNADRRVEILVHVPAGRTRTRGRRARARGPGRAEGAEAAAPPQSNSYSFTGLFWDVLPVVAELQRRPAQPQRRADGAHQHLRDWSSVSGSDLPDPVRRHDDPLPVARPGVPGRAAQRPLQRRRLGAAGERHARRDVVDERHRRGRHGDQHALHLEHRLHRRAGAFDLESVYLHENGHVAGLGHSTDINAVMYPSYQTARCALAQDDNNGHRGALLAARARRPPVGLRHAPSGPGRAARDPDRALAAAADLLHGVLPPPLRRGVQRPLPRLQHADGDALRPGGDPGALHRAPARAAAGPRRGAAAGRRAALGAAAGGLASTWRGAS